jgi:prepilin-type N-terminal cleavage/methylation domain-containing protein
MTVTAAARLPRRRGMTLVELLVGSTVFGVVISMAFSFMAQRDTAFQMSLERMSALRNARHAVTTLSRDLETLSTDVPGHQPSLVYGDDDAIVFSTDYATNIAGQPFAVASPAKILTFFLLADSVTERDDDFVLYRRVNDGDPEVVARHLLRDGATPFFAFEREIGGGSAPADSVRMVRVTLVATNGLVGEHERSVRIERSVALPST